MRASTASAAWWRRSGGRRIGRGYGVINAATAAMPALTASLALELAPIRVNLIAPGFVDTPLSASIPGADLERRREELRMTLPIGRVVDPSDVAVLPVHLMVNTAITVRQNDVERSLRFATPSTAWILDPHRTNRSFRRDCREARTGRVVPLDHA